MNRTDILKYINYEQVIYSLMIITGLQLLLLHRNVMQESQLMHLLLTIEVTMARLINTSIIEPNFLI